MRNIVRGAALGAAVLAAPAAWACGGFFCDGGPQPPVQASERVVFTQRGDEVTAHVQIQYQGDPDDFAWVIPVPAEPRITTASPRIFDELDALTAPLFEFRYRHRTDVVRDDAEGGCGGTAAASGGLQDRSDTEANVRVLGMANVGPYATTTLTSDDPNALVNWLIDNGYRLPANAGAILAGYVDKRSYFVALRLRSSVFTGTLEPIAFTYRGQEPCIPLRITALASTDVLDVTAFVIADARATSTNYSDAQPAYADVRPDPARVGGAPTTYWLIAQSAVAAAGGRAFVTEIATPVSRWDDAPVAPETRAVLGQGRYLTRLFTRIRREDMIADPMFRFTRELPDVDNRHVVDLTDDPFYARARRVPPAAWAALPLPILGFWLRRRRAS